MKANNLKSLVDKIERLIDINKQLKHENDTLKDNVNHLSEERDRLRRNNKLAQNKISTIVEHLKALERKHEQR